MYGSRIGYASHTFYGGTGRWQWYDTYHNSLCLRSYWADKALNAEEEAEELDYPGQKNLAYKEKFAPRGVMHTWATDKDDAT